MQPITMSLNKGKILQNMSWRFQKDDRTIKCARNSNNFILNIRNYSKFIFVSNKAGRIDNSSVLVGSKVICCLQVQVNSTSEQSGAIARDFKYES